MVTAAGQALPGQDRGVLVLTTGGSMDKVYTVAGETVVGPPRVLDILQEVRATIEVEHREILRKDSLEITDDDRELLRQVVSQMPQRRVLITHGTDTMPETARFLEGIPGKVVVLTGSMQPHVMRVSDAAFNIGVALGALQSLDTGVFVAMNGHVFPATAARKDRQHGVFYAEPRDQPASAESLRQA